MKNMTLAFLACMSLATPSAMADSTIVDQTAQHRHMNTKDLYNGNKAQPATAPTTPAAPMQMAPSTGNADTDFARNMITHHQSGVDMAKQELASGTDPDMKKLAQSIVDSQTKEITQMQEWLNKHK